jgi:hypothetical protein
MSSQNKDLHAYYLVLTVGSISNTKYNQPFKGEAQTAIVKDPVRTAL